MKTTKILPLFLLITLPAMATINPLDYGIMEASTGTETFYILKKCHEDAARLGEDISYAGIDSLFIDIPADAEPLPLPKYTDFSNAVITVRNNSHKMFLFSRSNPGDSITINKWTMGNGEYPELDNGLFLLEITDRTPWVDRRIGYSYGATRKDLVVVQNKKALNRTISPYNNAQSDPSALLHKINTDSIVFRNLTLIRTADSKYKTFIVSFDAQYNLRLSSIILHTPDDASKYADEAISITNSALVTLDSITIDGTYSQTDRYGYGISLDNIYSLHVSNMYARSKWGIFGTNNINSTFLEHCDINRFDIHCYGRDVLAYGCRFSSLYNQFSSIFRSITFQNCIFDDCTPLLIESSYNAYTLFDLYFLGCTFHLTKSHDCLINLMSLDSTVNTRPELSEKSLPNITLANCTFDLDKNLRRFYLINTGKVTCTQPLSHISVISLNDIILRGKSTLTLLTTPFPTRHPVTVTISATRYKYPTSRRSRQRTYTFEL